VDKKSKVSMGGATGGSSRNLWVSGLSSSTRATDLKQVFSKYGKVRHSTLWWSSFSCSCTAYVEYFSVLSTPLVFYLCLRDCNTYMNPVCLILITTEIEQRTLNNEHMYVSV